MILPYPAGRMNLEPLFTRHRDRLRDCTSLPEVFAGRGLTLAQFQALDLGLDEHGNGVIALRDLDGYLIGLKVRLLHAGPHRYLEIPSPNGNPPWFPAGTNERSSNLCRGVLCVEGELNAMVSSLALRGSDWAVVGLGSAFGPVPWDWLRVLGVPVVFSLDPGRVGQKSIRAWLAHARERGLPARRAEPLLSEWDACRYAATCGLEALTARWLQVLRTGVG